MRARRYRRLFRLMAGFTAAFGDDHARSRGGGDLDAAACARGAAVHRLQRRRHARSCIWVFGAPPSQRVAAIEASLWQYVRMRESWNAWDAEYSYDVVSAMSAPNVRDAYQAFANSRDPENPAVKFGKSAAVRVDRLRSGFLPRHAEDYSRGAYSIDFCRVVMIEGASRSEAHDRELGIRARRENPAHGPHTLQPGWSDCRGVSGPTQIGAPRRRRHDANSHRLHGRVHDEHCRDRRSPQPQQSDKRIKTVKWVAEISSRDTAGARVGNRLGILGGREVTRRWTSSMSDMTKPDYGDHTAILKPKRTTPLTPLFVRTERDGIERVYPFAFEAVENAEAPYVVRILPNRADAIAAQRAAWARRKAALEQQRAQAALAAAASMPQRNTNYTIQAGK